MACHYLRNRSNMVSLSDDGRRSGGFFFDSTNADIDELITDSASSLGHQDDKPFRRIHTTAVIVILLIITIALELEIILLPYFISHYSLTLALTPYSILVYSHAGVWFIFLLADRYLRRQHRISRSYGYLEFYRKTRQIRRLPILINSGGNVMVLILTCLLWDFCEVDSGNTHKKETCSGLGLQQSDFLRILVSLEVIALITALIVYLVRTVRFNRGAAPPDVHQEDAASGYLHAHPTTEVGFRDENFLDDVLEKQADMIRYLKQHNAHLGKKIVHMTAELEKVQQ